MTDCCVLFVNCRWKSSNSATCGPSTISAFAAKKWAKSSNRRRFRPEPTTNSNGKTLIHSSPPKKSIGTARLPPRKVRAEEAAFLGRRDRVGGSMRAIDFWLAFLLGERAIWMDGIGLEATEWFRCNGSLGKSGSKNGNWMLKVERKLLRQEETSVGK